MEAVFKEFGIKFDLPENTLYYNKNDVLNMLGFSKKQLENCIMVVRDKFLNAFVIVNYLGETETDDDYKKLVKDLITKNKEADLELYDRKHLSSEDKRVLDIQIYHGYNSYTIAIFAKVKNRVFFSVCSCGEEVLSKAEEYSTKIMQNIFDF